MVTMRQQLAEEQNRMEGQVGLPPGSAGVTEDDGGDARRHAILEQAVERDVIPRLLLSRREVPATAPIQVADAHVAELTAYVLARNEPKSRAFVDALYAAGFSAEMLYLDLLAPVARRLGQMWVEDDCDFTDVTVGLFVLQNGLRMLSDRQGEVKHPAPDAPRILLVPLPREQHTFGLTMVDDFFRRAGWYSTTTTLESDEELRQMVRESWYDVVGFSLACDEQLDGGRRAIRMVRAASRNPRLVVMVGGPRFMTEPDLAETIGADGTAIDGRQAVMAAEALLAVVAAQRCS